MVKRSRNIKHTIIGAAAILVVVALFVYAIFGNKKQRDIIGTWVTDTSAVHSGFQCSNEGIAATICNPTRQYNSWELKRNKLILKGKLFRDYRIFDISDTLEIKQLSSSSMTVVQHGHTTKYRKTR